MSRTEKLLFAVLFISTMVSGCSSGSLDTSPKHDGGNYQIKRWNTQTLSWEATNDSITVTTDWQFISVQPPVSAGSPKNIIAVKGCYTSTWVNSTKEKVDVRVGKLTFVDGDGKPVSGVSLNDKFTINPKSTYTYTGTFDIVLANIGLSRIIRVINSWVDVSYQP